LFGSLSGPLRHAWMDPQLVFLLSEAAGHSRGALNRLAGLTGDADTRIRILTIRTCGQHADRLSDQQLTSVFEQAMLDREQHWSVQFDPFLVEMIRRPRPQFREQIARWVSHCAYGQGALLATMSNLEPLTALRRIDQKPDPLRIVALTGGKLEASTDHLPTIHARLENVDSEQASILLRDRRSAWNGLPTGWRFQVTDVDGRSYPSACFGAYLIRELRGYRLLKPNEAEEYALRMSAYLKDPLPPGRYWVVLQYHGEFNITCRQELSDLIFFSSEPFELVIRPAPTGSRGVN
jgi:hypothetical protein